MLGNRITNRPFRIAVIGGDGRHERAAWPPGLEVRTYGSAGEVGAGELRRLLATIRSGDVALVVALARWLGHSATDTLRRTCRRAGVRFVIWDRGMASLLDHLGTLVLGGR
jgi:DNA invertase Pin-like site-specific DNA recombinase